MRRIGLTVVLAVGLTAGLLGPVNSGGAMELRSPAYSDGGRIPQKYAMRPAGGRNVSIPLEWDDVPEGTRSFALSVVDPHPIANNWVHWLVVNLPAEARKIPEGATGTAHMPDGALELRNGFGKDGYGGPQPPQGSGEHPYVATLYALDVAKLDVANTTTLASFNRALQGHILAEAKVTGHYGR